MVAKVAKPWWCVCVWWFSADNRFCFPRLKFRDCLKDGGQHQRKQGKLHEHQSYLRRSPIGQPTASTVHWILNVFMGPNSGSGELKVFYVISEALPSFFLAGHRCYSFGCFLKRTQTVSHMRSLSHCYRPTYQVTCGSGEARTVHASVTSILSQTACTLRGIQNIGGRPERSSMYSFSAHAFSTAYNKDRLNKGNRKRLCSNYPNFFTKWRVIMRQCQEYKALFLMGLRLSWHLVRFSILSRMLISLGNYNPVGVSVTNTDVWSDLPPKGLPVSSHTQQSAVPNNVLFQLFHVIPKPNSLLPPLF